MLTVNIHINTVLHEMQNFTIDFEMFDIFVMFFFYLVF